MIIKAAELKGAALDWAAAKTRGAPDELATEKVMDGYSPSTDWSQGGPLIDRYDIDVWSEPLGLIAEIAIENVAIVHGRGDTRLVAAMRAIVAAGLGEAVDIPAELCQ